MRWESKVCYESTWGTVNLDLKDQKRLQIRGNICLITEPKGRVGINQVTKRRKEYSRHREYYMENLSDKREQAHLKKWIKFSTARNRICKQENEWGSSAVREVSIAGRIWPKSHQFVTSGLEYKMWMNKEARNKGEEINRVWIVLDFVSHNWIS